MSRLALPLAVLLSGCTGFSWPTPDPTCEVLDTWEVDCNCAGIVRGSDITFAFADSLQSCELDHDGDGRLVAGARQQVCDKIAFRATLEQPDFYWECFPAGERLVSSDDCPRGSACTGSASEPLIGWSNSQATFIGELAPELSYVNLTIEGETVSPELAGDAFVTGGYCPGEACEMRVDRLSVDLGDFTIHGFPGRQTGLVTMAPWEGFKSADSTYAFDADAPLKLAGTIDGDRGFVLGAPIEPVGGAFHDVPVPLPGGGSRLFQYMTIEGTFAYSAGGHGGTAEVYLVFPFGTGAPRPEIEAVWRACTVVAADDCGWTFDASGSRDYVGGPVAYDWFDAHGTHLGRDAAVYADQILEIPGEPSRFPLTLYVTDGQGRFAWTRTADVGDDPEDPESSALCSVVGATIPAGWLLVVAGALIRRRRLLPNVTTTTHTR